MIGPRARRLVLPGLLLILGCSGTPTFERSLDGGDGNLDAPIGGEAPGTGGSGTGGDTLIGTGGAMEGGTGGGGGGMGGAPGSGGRQGTGGAGSGGMSGSGGRSGTGGAGSGGMPGTGGISSGGGAGGMAGVSGSGGGGPGGTGMGGGAGGAVSTGLVLHYTFDQNNGTNIADASGNNRTGMLVGTGSFMMGRKGNALSINGMNGAGGAGGSTGGHVVMPANVVSTLNAATVSLWLNVRAPGNWPRVFEIANSTSRYMGLTSSVEATGALRFTIRMTSGTGNDQVLDGPVLPTNTWKHVVVVLAGAPAGGTLYVDGAPVDTDTAVTLRPSDIGNTTMNWLGRSQYTSDTYFNGLIDELRIYNRALTAAEVMALFSSP